MKFKMGVLDWTAVVLVVVGALNWGLVGIAYFVDATANWNIVNILFESIPELEALVYIVVGLAGIWLAYMAFRLSGAEFGEMEESGRATR